MTRLLIVNFLCLLVLACSRPHTIIIDDLVQSKRQLEELDTSEIFSYSKWLPGEAPQWYDKWRKTTIIVVKTKKTERKLQKERHALLNRLLDSVDKGSDILIVQDGIIIPPASQMDLRKMSPDRLSNADTMEWQAAKRLYESVARRINLIINTYAPKKNYIP